MATSPTVNLPTRSSTTMSGDGAPGEDTSEVTKLFHERLQAYKHACRYIEDYIQATEKMQKEHSKEYEKVLKTVNQPLREGEMFDRNPGGIPDLFDTLRANTLAISNSHTETSKTLDQGVLPLFKRLHSEIKNKQSELAKGVGKAGKQVEKARAETAKHVEKLGTASATYLSHSGKADPNNDPYVIQRSVYYRLNKQIQEENSTRQDMISVQDNFSDFEAHIIKSFQSGLDSLMQALGAQADQQKQLYNNVNNKSKAIDPLFEWKGFVQRESQVLIDKDAPPKTLQNTAFANKDHASTQPMVQGNLERKQGMLHKFSAAFFAVTPARFMHQYASDEDITKDPQPELSLYLPDCTLGAINGNSFNIKGKDISSTMSKMGQSKDYEFKARSSEEAETWWGIIRGLSSPMPSSEPNHPLSPVEKSVGSRNVSGASQTTGVTAASPTATQESGITNDVKPAGEAHAMPSAADHAVPASGEPGVPASSASAEVMNQKAP